MIKTKLNRRVNPPPIVAPIHRWNPNTPTGTDGYINIGASTFTDIGTDGTATLSRVGTYPQWTLEDGQSFYAPHPGYFVFTGNGVHSRLYLGDVSSNFSTGFTFSAWLSPSTSNARVMNVVLSNITKANETDNGFKLFTEEATGKMGIEIGNGTSGVTIYGPDVQYDGGTNGSNTYEYCTWKVNTTLNTVEMLVNNTNRVTAAIPAGCDVGSATDGLYQIGRDYRPEADYNLDYQFYGAIGDFGFWDGTASNYSVQSHYDETVSTYG